MSKYLHKSRCRPHAAPAILLANLGPGISPRGGSRSREGGAGAGWSRGAYPGPAGTLPTGPGCRHVPVSRQSQGRTVLLAPLSPTVLPAPAPAGSPESFGGWFFEVLSLEGREFPALLLRGNPPPAPGSSFSLFSFSTPLYSPPPRPLLD